ncbi:hypothetical protein BD414DRAFT_456568 [Trametes punicea]|nr:hypothetical protein BD414DRAFT_456568 [Trametes punicea]
MGSNSLALSPSLASSTDADAALSEALRLSSKARQFDARGKYHEAERLLLHAIELVEPHASADSTVAALWKSLGEVYLHMGRLDDAERWLNKSLDVSVAIRDFKEITSTRENLARVSQARSELLKAKALRMLGAPDDMRCGNHGGAFYCSGACQVCPCQGLHSSNASLNAHESQRNDWDRHQKLCRQCLS